jgi:stearoyl-CoA desaturase (delta-9 desaturase)
MRNSLQPITAAVSPLAEDKVKPPPVAAWLALLVMSAMIIAYLAARRMSGFGPLDETMLAAGYLLTGFGVTGGYHRLVTHRSYALPPRARWILLSLGAMALQGSIFYWAANHRQHHRYSDRARDPHSPVDGQPRGLGGLVRGFVHAQMGWYLSTESMPSRSQYIPDLVSDLQLSQLDGLYPVFVVLSLAIPTAIGALVTRTALGALDGLFWGGIIRVVLLHHTTGTVNSVCHLLGARPYPTTDNSRNNFVVALMTLGEGWHNNHHAFPTSAFHGLRWWQIDVTGRIISILEMMKIATKVKVAQQ